MPWQDIVISVATMSLSIVLVPQLIDCINGDVMNLQTSSLTAVMLYVLALTFSTMDGYWLSTIANLASGSIWLSILVLSLRNIKRGQCRGDQN